MSPTEVLKAVEAYLAAPDPAVLPTLAQHAAQLADMVGWAAGPIDPQGRLLDHLDRLAEVLRGLHAQAPDDSLANLHDALLGLAEAVARHDSDLDPDAPTDDLYLA